MQHVRRQEIWPEKTNTGEDYLSGVAKVTALHQWPVI